MPELRPILDEEDIRATVARLAQQISTDYRKDDLVLIGVLKGAFVFLADLVRHLTIPVKVDFICLSSYGAETVSRGSVQIKKELDVEIENKAILIVEDIVDTGLSMKQLVKYLQRFKPKSVKICALIDKRERRRIEIEIDYIGHVIEHGFLVGYGLDCAEDYRYLPAIYYLQAEPC